MYVCVNNSNQFFFTWKILSSKDFLHYIYPDDYTQCPADDLDHSNSKEHTTEYAQCRM